MRLIVGLGNPGRKYAKTRHNFGFKVIDELARRWDITVDKRRHYGRFGGGSYDRFRVGLLKPTTYMNRSGRSAAAALRYYKLSPGDMLVVFDDLSLPLGQIRIRTKGSAGGHKGLIDILERLGTDEVPRLRLGIGSPPAGVDGVDYVLAPFGTEEQPIVHEVVSRSADAIELIQTDGYSRAMDRYNRTAETPETR